MNDAYEPHWLFVHHRRLAPSDPPSGLLELDCQDCDSSLDLIQPDALSPDRMIGVCPVCRLWYLVEVRAELGAVAMIRLPAMFDDLDNLGEGERSA